jgi:hypothetical protein
MNPRFVLALVLLVCLVLRPIHRTPAQTSSPEPAVRQTVETCLHGLKFNAVESFKKLFHPDAKLFLVRKNGKLGAWTLEQWYKGFAAGAGKEEKGELRIAAVANHRDGGGGQGCRNLREFDLHGLYFPAEACGRVEHHQQGFCDGKMSRLRAF